MIKNNNDVNAGYFEYKMTNELAQSYLKMRKGKERTSDIQNYLCNIVNEEYGIKGICTKVLTF